MTTNKTTGLSRQKLGLVGKPASGKTVTAATYSKHWKKGAESGWRKLSDMLWIPFDEDATLSLLEHKAEVATIDVPKHIAEATDDNGIVDIYTAMNAVLNELYETHKPGVTVVVDTPTELDKWVNDYFGSEEYGPRTKDGKRDSFAVERLGTGLHRRFFGEVCKLGASVIFCMHLKRRSGKTNESRRRDEATGLAGSGIVDLTTDFYYDKAASIYRNNLSYQFVCDQVEKKGEPTQYRLLSNNQTGFGAETKNRLKKFIKPIEEPNLYKLFARVTKDLGLKAR